jgi:hypothetical protein
MPLSTKSRPERPRETEAKLEADPAAKRSDASLPDKPPVELTRPSADFLDFRARERHLILERRFEHADKLQSEFGRRQRQAQYGEESKRERPLGPSGRSFRAENAGRAPRAENGRHSSHPSISASAISTSYRQVIGPIKWQIFLRE